MWLLLIDEVSWTTELVKQVPSLAALIWLVLRGLAAQREQATEFLAHLERRDKTFAESITVIGDGCHEHTSDITQRYKLAVDRTSEALQGNATVLARVEAALDRLE